MWLNYSVVLNEFWHVYEFQLFTIGRRVTDLQIFDYYVARYVIEVIMGSVRDVDDSDISLQTAWLNRCPTLMATTTAATVSGDDGVGRAKYSTLHYRRPCLSCSSRSSLEHFSQLVVSSSPLLTVFRRRLKTERFTRSYDLNYSEDIL